MRRDLRRDGQTLIARKPQLLHRLAGRHVAHVKVPARESREVRVASDHGGAALPRSLEDVRRLVSEMKTDDPDDTTELDSALSKMMEELSELGSVAGSVM